MIGNWINFLLGLLFIVAISSCEKTSCAHVTCPSNLQCVTGSCICDNGYEGDSCTTLSYLKYLGNWTDYDGCSDGSSGQYNVHILSAGGNTISISPIFNTGKLTANIINTPGNLGATLSIPAQLIGSITVLAGSTGTYSSASTLTLTPTIVLNLNYSTAVGTSSCTQTLTFN